MKYLKTALLAIALFSATLLKIEPALAGKVPGTVEDFQEKIRAFTQVVQEYSGLGNADEDAKELRKISIRVKAVEILHFANNGTEFQENFMTATRPISSKPGYPSRPLLMNLLEIALTPTGSNHPVKNDWDAINRLRNDGLTGDSVRLGQGIQYAQENPDAVKATIGAASRLGDAVTEGKKGGVVGSVKAISKTNSAFAEFKKSNPVETMSQADRSVFALKRITQSVPQWEHDLNKNFATAFKVGVPPLGLVAHARAMANRAYTGALVGATVGGTYGLVQSTEVSSGPKNIIVDGAIGAGLGGIVAVQGKAREKFNAVTTGLRQGMKDGKTIDEPQDLGVRDSDSRTSTSDSQKGRVDAKKVTIAINSENESISTASVSPKTGETNPGTDKKKELHAKVRPKWKIMSSIKDISRFLKPGKAKPKEGEVTPPSSTGEQDSERPEIDQKDRPGEDLEIKATDGEDPRVSNAGFKYFNNFGWRRSEGGAVQEPNNASSAY